MAAPAGLTELLVHGLFEHVGVQGLRIPQWDRQQDLEVLAALVTPGSDKASSIPLDTLLSVVLPPGLGLTPASPPTLDDHKLVEKIVPYTSVLPMRQALFADLAQFEQLWASVVQQHVHPQVGYHGHDVAAWHAFWQPVQGVLQATPSHWLLVDSAVDVPPLEQLYAALEPSATTVYLERVNVRALDRCWAVAQCFRRVWLVSSCHSGFPLGSLHLVCQDGPWRALDAPVRETSVTLAALSVLQRLCVRQHRNFERWKWIQLFPRQLRSALTTQPVYQAWEQERRRFWQTYCPRPPSPPPSPVYHHPTSPVYHYPTSPGYAPTSPRAGEAPDALTLL